jgi:hypothetical protein
MDLRPLRRHRDYRALYSAQLISFLGSMVTYVALPYQMDKLTGSSLAVGWIRVRAVAASTPFIPGSAGVSPATFSSSL